MEELTVLIVENKHRQFVDPTSALLWQRTLEAAVHMHRSPGAAYKCGVYALANVGHRITGQDYRAIGAHGSPEGGFALRSLETIAERNNLPLRAAHRDMGDAIPVPSVVHWSQDHYAAIVNRQGDYYTVVDPTFGPVQYLTAQAINEEASGYFLTRNDEFTPGFRWITSAESSQVFGKGYTDEFDDQEDDPCPEGCCDDNGGGADGTGGECEGDDEGEEGGEEQGDDKDNRGPGTFGADSLGSGMARWSVSEPNINIEIEDIPMFYNSAIGPKFVLRVHIQQRARPFWYAGHAQNSHMGMGAGLSPVSFIAGTDAYGPAELLPAVILTGLLEAEVGLWTRGTKFHRLHFAEDSVISATEITTGLWAKRFLDESEELEAIEVYYRNGSMERYEPDSSNRMMNLTLRKDSNLHAMAYSYTTVVINTSIEELKDTAKELYDKAGKACPRWMSP